MTVSAFAERHFRHFNSRVLVDAAAAWRELLDEGGAMMVTLAGAMSTGELGRSLAELIRQDKVHAISCTGANLEESVFNLIGKHDYQTLPKYRDLTPGDEQELRDDGLSRVTDVAMPDDIVMMPVSKALIALCKEAELAGHSAFPHEYLYRILRDETLAELYQDAPEDCWLLAAAEKNLPIVVPGWEDSTLGNAYASAIMRGELTSPHTVRGGIEYMLYLAGWYAAFTADREIGFFQIGGGIAGDFPICVVPVLHDELHRDDLPLWAYFCQITDAVTSYGGYSGALPNEKITWGKLAEDTPSFVIESDASIVAPLLFALVLGE